MKELELISVVVPVYNVEQYIERCLKSIVSQSYTKLEIILVDDGSTDNSGKIADDFSKLDKRIIVFHKKNGGLSDARNYGIERSSGKYITFVDSDDFISPDCIEYLYDLVLGYNAQISICGMYMTRKEDENYKVTSEYTEVYNKQKALEEMFYRKKFSHSASAKLYIKELFYDVRFPIGRFCEDLFTTYKAIDKASTIVFGNKIGYYYYRRPDSLMTKNLSKVNTDPLLAFKQIQHDLPLIEYGIFNSFANCAFNTASGMLERSPSVKESQKSGVWGVIRAYRFIVLFDYKSSIKLRLLSLLSFGGCSFMTFLLKLYLYLRWT